MSKYIFTTHEGKRVVCDTNDDLQIYIAPRNPPNTGTKFTRGTDIYAHTAQSGTVFFYAQNWTMWQGEDESVELMTVEEVKDFFAGRLNGDSYGRPSETEISQLSDFGIELFEETA